MQLTLLRPIHNPTFRAKANDPVEVLEETPLVYRVRNGVGEVGWVAKSITSKIKLNADHLR